jgi:hypothetical protein
MTKGELAMTATAMFLGLIGCGGGQVAEEAEEGAAEGELAYGSLCRQIIPMGACAGYAESQCSTYQNYACDFRNLATGAGGSERLQLAYDEQSDTGVQIGVGGVLFYTKFEDIRLHHTYADYSTRIVHGDFVFRGSDCLADGQRRSYYRYTSDSGISCDARVVDRGDGKKLIFDQCSNNVVMQCNAVP